MTSPTRLVAATLLVLAGPAAARAQTSIDSLSELELVIAAGTRVSVEDQAGEVTSGTLARLTATSIVLERRGGSLREIAADRVFSVTKADSAMNGFLAGAATGAVPGLILAYRFNQYCSNESGDCAGWNALIAGGLGMLGGLIGMGIDQAHGGLRFTLLSSPGRRALRVTPVVMRGGAGVAFSRSF